MKVAKGIAMLEFRPLSIWHVLMCLLEELSCHYRMWRRDVLITLDMRRRTGKRVMLVISRGLRHISNIIILSNLRFIKYSNSSYWHPNHDCQIANYVRHVPGLDMGTMFREVPGHSLIFAVDNRGMTDYAGSNWCV